jgi:hypothetical protein
VLDLLHHLFAAVCGQNPGHTWAPGGTVLPCCQRCTGLYVGACVAALLHGLLRPKLTARFLEVHGAFLLAMAPFGWHWLPQGPILRATTGMLFGCAVVTYLWLPLAVTADYADRRTARRFFQSLLQNLEIAAKERRDRKEKPSFSHLCVLCVLSRPILQVPLQCWGYAIGLAAALLLLPLLAMQGGRLAAFGLSGLVCCGGAALACLVCANVALGLAGAVRFISRLMAARTRA